MLDRRHFVSRLSLLGLGATLPPFASATPRSAPAAPAPFIPAEVTVDDLAGAEKVAGVTFRPDQREMLLEDVQEALEGYEALRGLDLPNSVPPALRFDPFVGIVPPPVPAPTRPAEAWITPAPRLAGDTGLAFAGVSTLSHLLRTRQVTSVELTSLFLDRLARFDPDLHAVVTLMPERAMAEAAEADRELAAGRWRGPLHGIPYGAKDLLAARGAPTTWGTAPYREQTFEGDAAVVERLRAAGAVLVAKLTLGELAWGDVWFGGMTRNPWNVEQGSSGSSAGPGSAVAAGLVPFAIGSETLGSIVSPATRNGVTGLRPTFGRVSRAGAMALSWSMDKLGPMARSALDCALVFDAIHGADPGDATARTVPFPFDPDSSLRGLRVGYFASLFDQEYAGQAADRAALDVLAGLGVRPTPVTLPTSVPAGVITTMLSVEAAAAFDALTRGGGVDAMARQTRNAWPHVFRAAHLVPAVEYLQMARTRTLLMQQMDEAMNGFDVVVSPSFTGGILQVTNLTGHPCVVVPNAFNPVEGFADRRSPGSVSFIGNLDRDDAALRLAHAYQQATDFHLLRPPVGR